MWTAFILYNHSLFGHGLESLLQAQDGVVVAGVEKTGDEALARIEKLKPDVIIIEAEKRQPQAEETFSRYVREQPNARMICLSLQDNTAILYPGRRCTANSVEDLIRCVLTCFASER